MLFVHAKQTLLIEDALSSSSAVHTLRAPERTGWREHVDYI